MDGVSEPRHRLLPCHSAIHRSACRRNLTMPLPDHTIQHYIDSDPEGGTNWHIKKSKIAGRGIFAKKPIKSGTLIFNNKPLILGPRGDRAQDSFCSICYKIEDSCYPCSVCSLLVCSEDCNNNQKHTKECQFLITYWKLKPNCEKQPKDLTRSLSFIRSLLLDEEEKILLTIFQTNDNKVPVEELDALCSNYLIPDEHLKIMKNVDSIIKLNAFRIAHNEINNTVLLRGLYLLSGLMNHSCLPNTRNIFYNNYNMAVYASRDINEGEEIFTSYTGLLWCTPARRCQLMKTKHFWCKCARCGDRTEKGTRLSSLKCLNKECVGVLLPIDPLTPNSEWLCDNCAVIVEATKVSAIQCALGSLVGTMDLDNQFKLESLVLERLSQIIPYSNHIFVDLRLRLAVKLGFADGLKLIELSYSRLSLKENLCRGTLRTLAALGVGDAHLRGLLLYHLHAALAERARRHPELYEDLKTEIESTIQQAFHILQGDISAPPDLELRYQYLGPGCDKPHQERFFILDVSDISV